MLLLLQESDEGSVISSTLVYPLQLLQTLSVPNVQRLAVLSNIPLIQCSCFCNITPFGSGWNANVNLRFACRGIVGANR